MRYQLICCGLLFLTNTIYSESTVFDHQNQPTVTKTSPASQSSKPVNAKLKFSKKNIYGHASILYALMGDGGLNSTSFASTVTSSGQVNSYMPNVNANLGWDVELGYKFDPDAVHTVSFIYTNLNTSGTTTVNAAAGGTLYNDFTQFGNVLTGTASGFTSMSGPATATVKLSYGYENILLKSKRPYIDDGGTTMKFYHTLALRYMHLSKNFEGQYNGFVPADTTPSRNVSAQDLVSYKAEYYGLGPHAGAGSIWRANERLAIKGRGAASILAGFYYSNFNEVATAAGPVLVLNEALSQYTNNVIHPTQAWIPAIFDGQVSVLFDIITARPQRASLSIEGGFYLETILPIITNDAITENLGQSLDKLNNNLNMSAVFITLNSNID